MLVSVIIPVYNRAAYLPRLFRSLVQQTYRPLEIVLVDNGSADSSRRLCMAFKEEHHAAGFSVVCLDEAKRGCCACRNKGAQTARGEYLYFFDSDDEMGETFLEEAVSLLPADMVCAPTTMVMPDGRQVNRNAYYTASAADHILTSMLSTQSYIVRKSFFEKCGGWNEALPRWNDWEMGTRLLLSAPRLRWIRDKHFHRIHQHADSISGQSIARDFRPLLQSIAAVRADIDRLATEGREKQRACKALYAKSTLLAGHYLASGLTVEAALTLRAVAGLPVGRGFRTLAAALLAAAGQNVRGLWRIFHLFV